MDNEFALNHGGLTLRQLQDEMRSEILRSSVSDYPDFPGAAGLLWKEQGNGRVWVAEPEHPSYPGLGLYPALNNGVVLPLPCSAVSVNTEESGYATGIPVEGIPESPVQADSEDYAAVLIAEGGMMGKVAGWIRRHDRQFMHSLENFGKKAGQGFQVLRKESPEWEASLHKRTLSPGLFKASASPYEGEFTGAGLCAIACGVLEEGIRRRFGDEVEVQSVELRTSEMDPDQSKGLRLRPPMYHQVLRGSARNEKRQFTADPTYRQVNFSAKTNGRIWIIPTENEDVYYNYDEWRCQYLRDRHSAYAAKFVPQPHQPSELYQSFLQKVYAGKLAPITPDDYGKLLEALSD